MKLLAKILKTNLPKLEINHIFSDSKNMVATDTRILIVKKHGMEHIFEGKKCLIINPKAKVQPKIDAIEGQMAVNISQAESYPDYHRVLTKEPMTYMKGDVDGLTLLQMICAEKGVMIDFVNYAGFMKMLSKISFNRYYVGEKILPITIANDEYTIVLMPIVIQPL